MSDPTQIIPAAVPESPTVGHAEVLRRHSRGHRRGLQESARLRAKSTLFQPLPLWIWGIAIGLASWGAFTANPLLTSTSVLMLPVLASLLWFKGEPPVLLFACAMQWLQAAAAILYTNYYGMSLSDELEFGGPELVQATWLSLIGVLVLAIGMRLALIRRKGGVATQAAAESRLLQANRIFILYLIAFVVFSVIGKVASRIPGLTQPLLATATLKWVLVFLLAHSVLIQQRQHALLGIVVCLEIATGFMGFFSGFKSILFMLLVVVPGAHSVFKGWRLVQFCAVVTLVLAFGVVWAAIKVDYREFLNQGTGQQVVLVPVSQRFEKLGELVSGLNRAKLQDGLEESVLRMSYVKFFALTIAYVPEVVPFENGDLWMGTIQHVLMPRFLFPNKPVINDSERTAYYTGLQVASAEQGTSIGIGYMGESYIDFGPVGMFVPILLLGLFYGFIYRFFIDRHQKKVVGFAMATSILIFGAYTIETSNIKLVGGNLMALIVMGLFAKVAGPWFWRMIANDWRGAWSPERGARSQEPGRKSRRKSRTTHDNE